MEQISLNVAGMSCGHCVNAIENTVNKLSGVNEVSVQLKEGKVSVTYEPEKIELSVIKETIADQGYEVG